MQFHQNGDLYSVARVTGPAHNLLQVRVGGASPASLEDLRLRALGVLGSAQPPLLEPMVRANIIAGLRRAALEAGQFPPLREATYVVSDTGPEGIYEELAYALGCFIVRSWQG